MVWKWSHLYGREGREEVGPEEVGTGDVRGSPGEAAEPQQPLQVPFTPRHIQTCVSAHGEEPVRKGF